MGGEDRHPRSPFPSHLEDDAEITPLIAPGMARSNHVNLSPLAARLEAAVPPPRSLPVWAAFGLQPPDVDPSEKGQDRAS